MQETHERPRRRKSSYPSLTLYILMVPLYINSYATSNVTTSPRGARKDVQNEHLICESLENGTIAEYLYVLALFPWSIILIT